MSLRGSIFRDQPRKGPVAGALPVAGGPRADVRSSAWAALSLSVRNGGRETGETQRPRSLPCPRERQFCPSFPRIWGAARESPGNHPPSPAPARGTRFSGGPQAPTQ